MNFLKSTLLLGLSILLPVTLLWLAIDEIAEMLALMATPMAEALADWLPDGNFDNLLLPGVIAFLLIASISLLVGLAARTGWMAAGGRYIEDKVLFHFPGYKMLKVMSRALIDAERSDIAVGLLRDGKGGGDPCYVIEKHKDGRATILLPWSPATFAGNIKVVQQADIEVFDCSLDEYSRSVSQMGFGIEACIQRKSSMKSQ